MKRMCISGTASITIKHQARANAWAFLFAMYSFSKRTYKHESHIRGSGGVLAHGGSL